MSVIKASHDVCHRLCRLTIPSSQRAHTHTRTHTQLHLAGLVAAEAVRICEERRRTRAHAAAAQAKEQRRPPLRLNPRGVRRTSPQQARTRRAPSLSVLKV